MADVKTSYAALSALADIAPDHPFLHQPFEDRILTWTRAEALEDARRLARGLLGLGLQRGDKLALLSKNCAEWIISDIAISLAGLVSVPIYPTAGRDTITYVMAHSEAKALLIGKLDNPDVVAGAVPSEVRTVRMRYPAIDCDHDWNKLVAESEPLSATRVPDAKDTMTILYTSGSTGKPKGVVISYGAYEYASRTTAEVVELKPTDRSLSYLPLAHITERTCVAGPAIYVGSELYFADSLETFRDDLVRARPTTFTSVPRLWVQFQSGVHQQIAPSKLTALLKIPIVRGIVARKIRKRLGMEYTKLFGSGAAPISPLTLRWYEKLGIRISEGWGMSETCGLSCTNYPFRSERVGTIGMPIPGTEMKLSDEGEILVRSPGLLTEYYKQPELTRDAFDEDGFFRTGDKGEWIEEIEAFRITGRVKEIFKSAKGKYISPVPIEGKLAGNPLIEQVCVVGAGLRAPAALVVPSVAAREKSEAAVSASLEHTLEQTNATLESHEKLSHIYVLREAWSIENDLLTPTLKIKRDKIESKYGNVIDPDASDRIVWVDS